MNTKTLVIIAIGLFTVAPPVSAEPMDEAPVAASADQQAVATDQQE